MGLDSQERHQMNRHQRRQAAAANRHRQTGYLHRLAASAHTLTRPGVFHTMVAHDAGCAIYTALGSCNCVPDISIHPEGGGDVITVDVEGQTTRQRRQ